MGQRNSKTKAKNKNREKTGKIEHLSDSSSSSRLVENQSERETMSAWIREGVRVTDVYNVGQIIGHGHLGIITVVTRKKTENGFSEHHRNESNSSFSSVRSQPSRHRLLSCEKFPSGYSIEEPGSPGRKRNDKPRMYACKTVSTARMQAGQMEELLNEVRIMRELDHPHILHLFEVYQVKRRIWLVTELCTGGCLFRRIDTNTELDVCLVMEQICRAIAYMHRRGVCHRDLKLENVLYEHEGPDAGVKLIDFGLSQKFTRGTKMLRAVGTVYSVSPELVKGEGYTEMSDIFSTGCIAFVLLSGGKFPFLTDQESILQEEQKQRLLDANFCFGPEWDARKISPEGKEFVRCCLKKEPTDRLTAGDVLDFIRNEWEPQVEGSEHLLEQIPESSPSNHSEGEIPEEVSAMRDGMRKSASCRLLERRRHRRVESETLQGMKEFALYGQLKKRVLMIMAHTMDKSSLGELSELFIALDSEGTGTISINEMRDAVQAMYDEKILAEFTEEDIANMFKGIDQDRSGQIHYAEFLAAVLESQNLITLELLGEAFDRIDTQGKGYISRDDLRAILGRDYDEELVNRMMKEGDFKHNDQVDYDEFLDLMFEDPAYGELLNVDLRSSESFGPHV